MLTVTDEAHDPELLILQQAPSCLQSQPSGPQLPVNKYQEQHNRNETKLETCFQLFKITNEQNNLLVMSYKWQSDPKHCATKQSTDTNLFFLCRK